MGGERERGAGGRVSSVGNNRWLVFTIPAQLGPTKRMPCSLATRATSSSPARLPTSENPAVMITAACTPARPQSSSTPGTVAGGDTITARSTGRSICATA